MSRRSSRADLEASRLSSISEVGGQPIRSRPGLGGLHAREEARHLLRQVLRMVGKLPGRAKHPCRRGARLSLLRTLYELLMKQARAPTEAEFKRLAAAVSQGKYGPRNRMSLMLSYIAGRRVGEIASLRWGDLLDGESKVREQLRLSAAVTKGGHARVVFLNARLRKEIENYRASLAQPPAPLQPALITQKRRVFSAITLRGLIRG